MAPVRLLPLLFLLLAGCGRQSRFPAAIRSPSAEDSVHHAVLGAEAADVPVGETLYVTSDIPASFHSEAEARIWVERGPGSQMRRVPAHLALAYALANTQPGTIVVPGRLGGRAVARVVSDGAADRRTVHHLSRAGFNVGGDSAVVMVRRICGPLCGSSAMKLVVRERRLGWRVAATLWFAVH